MSTSYTIGSSSKGSSMRKTFSLAYPVSIAWSQSLRSPQLCHCSNVTMRVMANTPYFREPLARTTEVAHIPTARHQEAESLISQIERYRRGRLGFGSPSSRATQGEGL